MAGHRQGHQFLSSHHTAVVSKTNATIYNLRDVVDIDSWRKTAPFPYETMPSAPDMFFDESGTPGSAPSYQWYTKIEVACQNFRNALVDWRKCNEELDWAFRNNLVQTDLPNQIARLNRMHGEICGIDDLIDVANAIDVFFKYLRFFGQYQRCAGQHPPLFRFLGSFETSRRFVKGMTVCSKTEPPFSRIRSTCFFDDINFQPYKVPLSSGTRGTCAPQFEPSTSWSRFKNTINWDSRPVRTPTMRSH